MDIIEAIATNNKCYQMATPLTPQGIMLHSIGCPQPNAAVMARSYNQYQPGGQSVCVHGFIQRDGTYYQTLPYTMRAWHCGGSAPLSSTVILNFLVLLGVVDCRMHSLAPLVPESGICFHPPPTSF